MTKNCKECPWVVNTRNNRSFTGHAKKHNKTHNCHMVPRVKQIGVWNTNEKYECMGSKKIKNND